MPAAVPPKIGVHPSSVLVAKRSVDNPRISPQTPDSN
jgi:hypothetical protein